MQREWGSENLDEKIEGEEEKMLNVGNPEVNNSEKQEVK